MVLSWYIFIGGISNGGGVKGLKEYFIHTN